MVKTTIWMLKTDEMMMKIEIISTLFFSSMFFF